MTPSEEASLQELGMSEGELRERQERISGIVAGPAPEPGRKRAEYCDFVDEALAIIDRLRGQK